MDMGDFLYIYTAILHKQRVLDVTFNQMNKV